MSVAGILSSSFMNYSSQNVQSRMRQQEFQQLGQDLQAGNLSASQADFAALQQLRSLTPTSSTSSSNPIGQELTRLGKDLQAGNLSAAQQDYSQLKLDVQNQMGKTHGHHHHHGGGGGSDEMSQLMNELGQALQGGNLTTAQQAYTTLQQQFEQMIQSNGLTASQVSQSASSGLSISA
jgi:hypothetical protein